jgi:hypothetical protein
MIRVIVILIATQLLCSFNLSTLNHWSNELIEARIIKIKKIDGAFLLKAIKTATKDSISIISYSHDAVGNKIDAKNSKHIIADSTYRFILYRPTQYRVDNYTHIMLVVIGRDTVWKGLNIEKAPYYAINCRGLLITE